MTRNPLLKSQETLRGSTPDPRGERVAKEARREPRVAKRRNTNGFGRKKEGMEEEAVEVQYSMFSNNSLLSAATQPLLPRTLDRSNYKKQKR